MRAIDLQAIYDEFGDGRPHPEAIRFFIAGWVVAVCRGFITEGLWVYFAKRDGLDVNR